MLTCISFSNMIKNRFLSDFLFSSFLLQPEELLVLLNQVYCSSYPSICMIMNQDRLKMLFSNLRQMRGGHAARRQQSLKWTPHHIGSHEVFCVEIPTTRPVSQIKMLMIRHWLKEEKYAKDWGIPCFSIWWKWQEVT